MSSKTYNFSATVTSPENQQATASQPFIVSSANAALAGNTINASVSASNLTTFEQNFGNLVYPIGVKKIYFAGKNNPPSTTVTSSNAALQSALNNNIPVILCFEPTYYGSTNDAGWPGGADKPAQGTFAAGHTGTVLGDQFDMIATITGLQHAGLTIAAVCMWQECDNFSKYAGEMGGSATTPTADQVTYLYFVNYAALHATGVPVIISYGGYQQNLATSSQATTLMPFKTYLRPTDTAYVDGLTIDRYADGYHTLDTTPYSQGPGNTPTNSQRWGYGDMADFAGLPFGWIEAGNSASKGNDPTEAFMVQYIVSGAYTDPVSNITYPGDPVNSIQATFAYRLGADLPCLPFAWYMSANSTDSGSNGPNGIFNAGDFRIALLQRLYKTITGNAA